MRSGENIQNKYKIIYLYIKESANLYVLFHGLVLICFLRVAILVRSFARPLKEPTDSRDLFFEMQFSDYDE